MHIMHHSFKFETKTSFVLFWKAGLNESLLWRKSSHYQYQSVVLTNSVYQADLSSVLATLQVKISWV